MTAITRSVDHRYTYEGVTYPGVTSILKVVDKSAALMAWAARQTAEATLALLDEVDAVGRYPALNALLTAVGPEGFTKAVTSRSGWKRDEAAQLGTQIHAYADKIAQGLDTGWLDPVVLERVNHYAEWWKASGWRVRLTEAMIVNTEWGFGGTLDLLAFDKDGRTVLADVKSGKAVYKETVLQLCAYGFPGNVIQPAGSDQVFPIPASDRYAVLHVTAAGVREVEIPVGTTEMTAFLACLDLYHWSETMKGRKL